MFISPMMYDSLFSLAGVFRKSCIVFLNMSMSALGGVFGLSKSPSIWVSC